MHYHIELTYVNYVTHYDEKKTVRNPQIEPQVNYGGPRQRQASGTNKPMKVLG